MSKTRHTSFPFNGCKNDETPMIRVPGVSRSSSEQTLVHNAKKSSAVTKKKKKSSKLQDSKMTLEAQKKRLESEILKSKKKLAELTHQDGKQPLPQKDFEPVVVKAPVIDSREYARQEELLAHDQVPPSTIYATELPSSAEKIEFLQSKDETCYCDLLKDNMDEFDAAHFEFLLNKSRSRALAESFLGSRDDLTVEKKMDCLAIADTLEDKINELVLLYNEYSRKMADIIEEKK